MKKVKISLLILISLASLSVFSCSNNKNEELNTIIYGNIFTGINNIEEAVVIKNDQIIYVGNKEGAKDYKDKAKEIIELSSEKLVIPGIIDGHSHPATAWDNELNSCMLDISWDMERYKQEIASWVMKHSNPKPDVYRVKNYIESKFSLEDLKNPKAILDKICDDVPLVAIDEGGHSLWCNTKAIEKVIKDNPQIKMVDVDHPFHDDETIPGGVIERNEVGEAIGFFRDRALVLVSDSCITYTKDLYISAIKKAQEEYASLGYTSYNETAINETSNVLLTPKKEAYEYLEKQGLLTSYVVGSYIIANRDNYMEEVNKAIKIRDETKGGNFEVKEIKIFIDGVVEGESAYLKDPYILNIDGTPAGDYRGLNLWPEEDLEKLTNIIIKANEVGMAVHFHAVGDQASINALMCIENAAKEIGIEKVKEARNIITHLQIVDESSYEKLFKYNVIANINPWGTKAPGFYNEIEVPLLGEVRASNEYPYKTFLNKSIRTSFGTDYSATNIYHLNECFYTLTTRKYISAKSKEIKDETELNAKEALSRKEALNILTSGGSYQLKKENEFGTIEVGKKANLVILNQNLLSVDEKNIINTKALRTMFQGIWVYKDL